MPHKSKKYKALVSTSKELFWKHGFKRVSIEEICKKANVSKMTFYKYFPNKIELAKHIFNMVVRKGEKQFREILKSDASPAEKVKKVMLIKIESTNDISPEFMQDFYIGKEPELNKFVEERSIQSLKEMRNDYKKAQAQGVFRKDFDPELLIKIQQKLVELYDDKSLLEMFDSQQEMIMAVVDLLIYGIVPHE